MLPPPSNHLPDPAAGGSGLGVVRRGLPDGHPLRRLLVPAEEIRGKLTEYQTNKVDNMLASGDFVM